MRVVFARRIFVFAGMPVSCLRCGFRRQLAYPLAGWRKAQSAGRDDFPAIVM
jgi:hypothetical protein